MKTFHFICIFILFFSVVAIAQDIPNDTTTIAQDTLNVEQDSTTISINTDVLEFTDAEKSIIDSLLQLLTPDEIQTFDDKFQQWETFANQPEMDVHSNPNAFKREEYDALKTYALSLGKAYIGLIIKYYQEKNTGPTGSILLSITLDDFDYLLEESREEYHAQKHTDKAISLVNIYFKKIISLIKTNESQEVVTSGNATNKTGLHLSVFPNPVIDQLTVQFEMPHPARIEMFITNLAGQKTSLTLAKQYYPACAHQITVPIAERLNPGMYFIWFDDGIKKVAKMIIVN